MPEEQIHFLSMHVPALRQRAHASKTETFSIFPIP